MDALLEYDATLPVDMESSCNPDLLTEVTLTHLEYPDGSVPMVAKTNSGRMSPVRARTMKEYDAQIGELKKENFSLKLRIYYLNERIQQKFGDEDVFKTNIELKVELDSLKKELSDKQELLKKASAAMETMTNSQQEDLAQIRQQHQGALQQMQCKLERQLQATQQEAFVTKRELENAKSRIHQLEMEATGSNSPRDKGQVIKQQEEALFQNQRVIDELRAAVQTKSSQVNQLEAEVEAFSQTRLNFQDTISKLEVQLKRKEKDLERLVEVLKGENHEASQSFAVQTQLQGLRDEVHDQEDKIKGLEKDLEQLKSALDKKDDTIGKLEDLLRDKDEAIKSLESEKEQITKGQNAEKEIQLKAMNMLRMMTMKAKDKEKEVSTLCSQLEKKEENLKEARDELHKLNMDRLESLGKQHAELSGNEELLQTLEAQVKEKNLENERLKRSLGKKEGETGSYKELLFKAETALRQSEEAVQVLQDQLQKERENSTDKIEAQSEHYQAMLDGCQRQLENKEKILQQLTGSLKDKDRQIHDCMALNTPSGHEQSKDALLKKFQEKLKERDKSLEDSIEDKFKALEERDKEIRELKTLLRERDRDIERANQMLLTAEETIDSLDNEIKEKDKNTRELANSLRSAQKAAEDALDKYTQSLDEKDAIVKRLQTAVASRDKALQEAVCQSPDVENVRLQQLQQRLTEKDKLMIELMEERNAAAQNYDQVLKENHLKLKDKENEMKQMTDRYNTEVSELARDNHRLQADVNKKDYELQTSENRATWAEEQQQEMLDKMRHALQEKDKTIEALVESGREKDKLFRQIQGSQSTGHTEIAIQLAEVQRLKEDLAQLRNELRNKDDLIERLKRYKDQRLTAESPDPQRRIDLEVHKHTELHKVIEEQVNESRRLNDALQSERQIYINLNSTSDFPHRSAFDNELAAIQTLRRELDEGIDRNNRIRASLEREVQDIASKIRSTDYSDRRDSITDQRNQIESLRTQLEESKRVNVSLQTCLQEQQKQRGDGVGGATETARSNINLNITPYSFAEPASLHLDDISLDSLSSVSLRKTVKDLHGQLSDSHRLNLSLKSQLAATETFRDVPGENNLDSDSSELSQLKQQLQECRELLDGREKENQALRFKFGLGPGEEIVVEELPDVDELQADLLVMKSTLNSVENVNTQLKKQVQLNNAKCGDDGPSAVINPDLILQMSQEIEKLRDDLSSATRELEIAQSLQEESSRSADSTSEELPAQDEGQGQGEGQTQGECETRGKPKGSQIPRLRKALSLPVGNTKLALKDAKSTKSSRIPVSQRVAAASLFPDLDSPELDRPEAMRTLLRQYRLQLVDLQQKLAGTEATVRSQGRRCKYYKELLANSGLLPKTPYRTLSESCIDMNISAANGGVVSPGSSMESSREQLGNNVLVREGAVTGAAKPGTVSVDQQQQLLQRVKSLTEQLEQKDSMIRMFRANTGSASNLNTGLLGSPASRSSPVNISSENVVSNNVYPDARDQRFSQVPSASGPDIQSRKELQQLYQRIQNLQQQLEESNQINGNLRLRLLEQEQREQQRHGNCYVVATQTQSLPLFDDKTTETILANQCEIASLRKQLAESQNICRQLSGQLENLGQLVVEYLEQDQNGGSSGAQPGVSAYKTNPMLQALSNTQDLVRDLSCTLDVMDHTADGGDSITSLVNSSELQNKYQRALQEIDRLRGQLTSSGEAHVEKMRAAEGEKQHMDRVNQQLRHELKKRDGVLQSKQDEFNRLQKFADQKHKELAKLQREVDNVQARNKSLDDQNKALREQISRPVSVRSAAVGESREMEKDNRKFAGSLPNQYSHQRRETDTDSVQSDESWDALEREGYRPVGSTSNAKSRGQLRKLPDSDSLESDEGAWVNTRSKPSRKESEQTGSKTAGPGLVPETSPMERLRHRTTSGNVRNGAREWTEGVAFGEESIGSSSQHSNTSQRGRHPTDPSQALYSDNGASRVGIQRLWASQNSRDIFVQNTGTGNATQDSSQESQHGIPFSASQDLFDHNYDGAVNVAILDIDRYSLSGLDSDVRSNPEKSGSPSTISDLPQNRLTQDSEAQVGQLKSKLKSVEVVNQTLKDELNIYQNIRMSIGVGPKQQSSFLAAGAGLHVAATMTAGLGTQTSLLDDDLETALLQEHLAEIRAMRIRLEASLNQNDLLRDQLLQRQLHDQQGNNGATTTTTTTTATVQLENGQHSERANSHDEEIVTLQKRILQIQMELREKEARLREAANIAKERENMIRERTKQVEERDRVIKENDKQLVEKSTLCKKLIQQRDKLEADLKKAGKESKRLRQENQSLTDQLQENLDLNKTLRFELNIYEKINSDTAGTQTSFGKKGFDIRELMTEIRRLRIQLEKCIDTNNSLRQKLEENLAHEISPCTHTSTVIRQIHSTDSSRPDSKDAADGMPSPEMQKRYNVSRHATSIDRYGEDIDITMRKTIHTEEDRRSQRGSTGSQRSHGSPRSYGSPKSHGSIRSQGSHGSPAIELNGLLKNGVPVPRLNVPYGSSVELNRSGHSSDGSVHMAYGFDTIGSHHSQSSEERDALYPSPRGLNNTWPNVDHYETSHLYDPGASVLSTISMPTGASLNLHQLSLSTRFASAGNLTYHVDDSPASFRDVFPPRVDPDIRHLFAVGKVDDYEYLKKENSECRTVLSGIEARITERLSRFKRSSPSQSIEYSTLKELLLAVQNLKICLGEENRLIGSFWVTQLPSCDEKGEFYSPRLKEKNTQLQNQLSMLQIKYNLLASTAKDAQTRLHATNRQKEEIEEAVIQQLTRTEKVLRHARGNLESKVKGKQKRPSPSPSVG